jgi:hypothetical protein
MARPPPVPEEFSPGAVSHRPFGLKTQTLGRRGAEHDRSPDDLFRHVRAPVIPDSPGINYPSLPIRRQTASSGA